MREVIDELSLKIDVNTKRGTAKTITAVADAITTLNKSVRNVGALERYVKTLNKLMKPVTRVPKNTAIGKTIKAETEEVAEPKSKAGQIATENLKSNQKVVEDTKDSYKELSKEMNNVANANKNVSKETDKSSKTFKKLIRSIGRIAFYRAIRTALNQIAKGIEEGFGNLRETDKGLDKSLKTLSQAQISFNNSLASLISPLIKTVEPFITKMADGIAKITNKISEANAVLKGQTTYTKILTSDTKEWNDQLKKAKGNLLSFDNIEALTTKKDEKDGYTGAIEAEVGMSAKEAQGIANTLESVKISILGIVGALTLLNITSLTKKIFTLKNALILLDGVLVLSIAKSFVDAIQAFKDGEIGAGILATTIGVALVGAFVLLNFNILKTIALKIVVWFQTLRLQSALATTSVQKLQLAAGSLFLGITLLIGGIAALASSWDSMKDWQKITTIFVSLAAAIAAAAAAYYAFQMNWGMAIGVGAMVAGTGLIVGSQLSTQKYADGGMVPKGTAFIAGEAGAEIVHQSSAGTGVANIEQIRQAQYLATMDAIQDSGILNALRNVGGDVIIDGRKCGQVVTQAVYNEGVRVGYFKKA